ncbi:cation:proton antiporter [Treponema sp.]|uniref:cation:proton antiporter domain-containing protein n=1 Tax=Treponema sp. TaxID=166 RepID=UPI0025F286C6|nr:cation:proton antiporter [Treponema sp.]MBR4322165.1 cation:proton antiporter [Treponema sp.]
MDITEIITDLVFQLALIIFAARFFGKIAVRFGIPSVLGELIAGIIIGPFALGGIALPFFPHGLFGVTDSIAGAVSPELYAFSQIASIILLFASGLETDLSLFIKYSVSGGLIGLGGVVISFFFGAACAFFILPLLGIECSGLFDVKCLFLGIMSTATSVGITARILSDKKKMDSPEGVTILAAAVFDDVLGIVLLAVVMGIVSALGTGKTLSGGAIGIIALKAFGIWLLATVAFVLLSKKIARFVRFFGGATDFSIAALGVAFLLAGFFEKEHIAMIIGAYTTGLALSGTDIAPVIQEKIHSLYKFFVPIFFAVTGMSVDVTKLFSQNVLICGGIYTLVAVLAKLLGCGLPALGLGFNLKGGFRIGAGMIPRGEVALIIAGIGLNAKDASGLPIVNQDLFGVVILMTLVTTLVAPPILNVSLSVKGRGTKKEVADAESQIFEWDFNNQELTHLIMDFLHRDLRSEGFYVQMMNITDGICTARRGDTAISLREEGTKIVIETDEKDMGFVKGELYETMLRLEKSMKSLSALKNTAALQYGFACPENRVTNSLTRFLNEKCISCELKGKTKDEILEEMLTLLIQSGNVENREMVMAALKDREAAGSTGLEKGIAIPHTKTNGVTETCVAIGIKKDGVDFDSMDGNPSKIFIMLVSPVDGTNPLMRAMAAFSGALMHEEVRTSLLEAKNPAEVVEILKDSKKI